MTTSAFEWWTIAGNCRSSDGSARYWSVVLSIVETPGFVGLFYGPFDDFWWFFLWVLKQIQEDVLVTFRDERSPRVEKAHGRNTIKHQDPKEVPGSFTEINDTAFKYPKTTRNHLLGGPGIYLLYLEYPKKIILYYLVASICCTPGGLHAAHPGHLSPRRQARYLASIKSIPWKI